MQTRHMLWQFYASVRYTHVYVSSDCFLHHIATPSSLAGLRVAQPCRYCFSQWSKNGFFAGRHVAPINVKLPRAKFHVYWGENVGLQPPKLSKFQILARNLYLRGDSFAVFLRNSQYLYASIGSF